MLYSLGVAGNYSLPQPSIPHPPPLWEGQGWGVSVWPKNGAGGEKTAFESTAL